MSNPNHDHLFEQLFKVFNQIYPVSDELKTAIIQNSSILEVQKKTQLLQAGEIANTIYFIVKGTARVYYLDQKGTETTNWFLFENDLLISVYSFYSRQPSFEYLETLKDCVLIALRKEKLDMLYNQFLEFNYIGRKLTESYYIKNEMQANDLRILGAKERYLKLLKRSPQLIQQVSLGYIASYLGISQETLSRIRKQI
nr:Crp/Fnr family transcriptional regulator [Pedobacter sp. ASV19]